MARLAGTDVVRTANKQLFLPVVISENEKLSVSNVGQNRNDEQLNRIREYYASTGIGDPYITC
jgi:hypothetical protein